MSGKPGEHGLYSRRDQTGPLPLTGTVVLDLTKMLPGAVMVKALVDMGARVIKVEEPTRGDMMRSAPPLVDGVGAGFRAFFQGTESVALDLRMPEGAASVRALARHADVVLESFRAGTLEKWGLGLSQLRARNSSLVTCSLSSYGNEGPLAGRLGHDLNFVAITGFLSRLPADTVLGVQIADVGAALQATTALLGALLLRHRTGRGSHVEQPLVTGPLPFLTWAMADGRAGGGGVLDTHVAGRVPAYRLYACADGRTIALGALEPKFWASLVEAIGLGHLAGDGLDTGERGRAATAEVATVFRSRDAASWQEMGESLGLPITVVLSLEEAARHPWAHALEGHRVPALGEATDRVLAEFGLPGVQGP